MAQPLVIVLISLKYAKTNEIMIPMRPDEATNNADVVSMED